MKKNEFSGSGGQPDRLLSLLGLTRRAGKLQMGFDAAVESAGKKEAFLLLAARDISEKTWKNLCYEAGRAGIPAIRIPQPQEAVGRACGKKAGVLAVTDRGLAEAVGAAAQTGKSEKEEDAL